MNVPIAAICQHLMIIRQQRRRRPPSSLPTLGPQRDILLDTLYYRYKTNSLLSRVTKCEPLPENTSSFVDSQFDPLETHNGSNYLLTDQTFFVTHEPCNMCSMALLHSRVKEVISLSQKTGTAGVLYAYQCWKGESSVYYMWKESNNEAHWRYQIDPTIDV